MISYATYCISLVVLGMLISTSRLPFYVALPVGVLCFLGIKCYLSANS
jgi:hypothetical protein